MPYIDIHNERVWIPERPLRSMDEARPMRDGDLWRCPACGRELDEEENDDTVFVSHDERIYVDAKSLVWLEGTVIDFIRTEEESGFAFQNPNVTNQCGCGESFYV